jgi:signal peptidase I
MVKSDNITVKVRGNSMLPLVREGDTVLINRLASPDIGDIVMFFEKDKLILHRVLGLEKNRLFTKGDFNLFIDKPVKKAHIIGVACFSDIRDMKLLKLIIAKISLFIGKFNDLCNSN